MKRVNEGLEIEITGEMTRTEPSEHYPIGQLGVSIKMTLLGLEERVFLGCQLCEDMFGPHGHLVAEEIVMERAGAAAIQIEDQVFPKKCGHFNGKEVIPCAEMVAKIKAAVDARTDADFQIIARTDARAIEGIDKAIERAHAFIEAGADATFVEAPLDFDEMARIARELVVPQIANIVFGGKTPDPGRARLADMGFGGVLYANASLQAALRAAYQVLGSLKEHGSLDLVADQLASFEERQRVVDKPKWDAMEARYKV